MNQALAHELQHILSNMTAQGDKQHGTQNCICVDLKDALQDTPSVHRMHACSLNS